LFTVFPNGISPTADDGVWYLGLVWVEMVTMVMMMMMMILIILVDEGASIWNCYGHVVILANSSQTKTLSPTASYEHR